jgi:hypothetical protein
MNDASSATGRFVEGKWVQIFDFRDGQVSPNTLIPPPGTPDS